MSTCHWQIDWNKSITNTKLCHWHWVEQSSKTKRHWQQTHANTCKHMQTHANTKKHAIHCWPSETLRFSLIAAAVKGRPPECIRKDSWFWRLFLQINQEFKSCLWRRGGRVQIQWHWQQSIITTTSLKKSMTLVSLTTINDNKFSEPPMTTSSEIFSHLFNDRFN